MPAEAEMAAQWRMNTFLTMGDHPEGEDGWRYAKNVASMRAELLTSKWFWSARTGHETCSHFEIMIVAPVNPLVLVQGISQWAPSGVEWSDGGAVHVHSTRDVDHRAWWDGSGSFSDGDVFSLRQQTPQNEQQAVAQTAASKGREMLRDCESNSR
jgi:hypothetical protein